MFLAFGVCAALLSANRTGKGQVVDAAMIDGVQYLHQYFIVYLSQEYGM